MARRDAGGQQEASEIYLDAAEGRGGFRFARVRTGEGVESGTTWYLVRTGETARETRVAADTLTIIQTYHTIVGHLCVSA